MENGHPYYNIMEEKNEDFITILKLLTPYGWQFIKKDHNNIIMNKKFSELEEINIQWDSSPNNSPNNYPNNYPNINNIHFSLPIKNSSYSFYKKFNYKLNDSSIFLDNYVHYLSI